MLKFLITICVIFATLFIVKINYYIAGENTKVFHKHDCPYARKIFKKQRFINYQDAINKGYKPCKVCKPTTVR